MIGCTVSVKVDWYVGEEDFSYSNWVDCGGNCGAGVPTELQGLGQRSL